jgi:aminopeptidase
MSRTFETMLDSYAELAVKVGVGLKPGQRLLIRASIECTDLTRRVVDHAYRAGALLVDVLYDDEQVSLTRYEQAPEASFDEVSTWAADAMIKGTERGDAILSIRASDPGLLKDQDPERVAKVQKNASIYSLPVSRRISSKEVNWSIVAAPSAAWATKVFPELGEAEAVAALWESIFRICRVDQEDPVGAWQTHIAALKQRREALDAKQYRSLRYRAPGTELELGLPDDHRWMGGESRSKTDTLFVANIPTEEVFTLPHRDRAEGTVSSSKPLAYAGTLIEDFSLRFEAGRVVEVKAAKGEAALRKLVETDEGASRLGEVALVPHGSPISQSGLLFLNTLYDENASSHLAVGRAYRICLEDGAEMSDEDFLAAGGNDSLAHVDFMIGSELMDVDGVLDDGRVEPVMRKGEWAFEI